MRPAAPALLARLAATPGQPRGQDFRIGGDFDDGDIGIALAQGRQGAARQVGDGDMAVFQRRSISAGRP